MSALIRSPFPTRLKSGNQSSAAVSSSQPTGGATVQIHPVDSYWEPVSFLEENPELPSQLHAKIIINGCPMHVEAYLVGVDGEVCDRKQNSAINCMKVALRDDQQWQTIDYEGRQYVVVAIPYGRVI